MPSEGTSGFSPIEIGLKYHIRHGGPSAVSPSLGFLLHVKLPSGSTVFKIRDPETTAVLLVDFDLSDRVSFGANLGVDVFEDDPGDLRTAGIFTGALGFGITESVGTFMEVASSGVGLSADDRVILVDAGLTYLFGPNAQIDTAAGFGVDGKTAPDFFVTVGFSFRGSYLK